MVQHLTIYAVEAEPKWLSRAHDWDSVWRGRHFDSLAT
jgi:hypothetical protein